MDPLHPFPSNIQVIIRLNEERRDLQLPENHPASLLFPTAFIEYKYPYNQNGINEYRNMFSSTYFKPDIDNKHSSKIALDTRLRLEKEIDASRPSGWLTPIGGNAYFNSLKLVLTSDDKVLNLNKHDHYMMYLIACGQNENEISKDPENRKGARFYMMDNTINETKQSMKLKIESESNFYISKLIKEKDIYNATLIKLMIDPNSFIKGIKPSELYDSLMTSVKVNPGLIYEFIKDEELYKIYTYFQIGLYLGFIKKAAFEYIYKEVSYKKQELFNKLKAMSKSDTDSVILQGWINKFKDKLN